MSDTPKNSPPPAFVPPVSSYGGPIAELIAQQMLAPPTRPGLLGTLQQFEIQRVLGSGGMGVVLLARDTNTGRSVAIKLIKPELVSDQRILHRFVKEAGHLQRLKHPHIIPVLEVSDRPSGPYFVMPYFEQGSLARCIRPGQPLDAVFILDVALGIAGGLQFAHRRGIIHRDLKPANILRLSDEQACLADFGLARTMFNDTIVDVEHQQCEGTAPYMSPGVAAGDAEDTRCDIYSFGALLYEMLTGEPPFVARTNGEIHRQILAGPPKPIKERNPNADDGLTAVAEGAMARALRDRYADMADVVADLERIKDGRRPVGPRGLVGGGLRQFRRLGATAGLGLFLVGIGIVSWFVFRPAPPIRSEKNSQTSPLVSSVLVTPPPATPLPVVPTAPSGWTVSVFAGQSGVSGSADGAGTEARFLSPGGVATDQAGNIYVADTGNNTIRKINPAGVVTTLAGRAGQHGSVDGMGNAARFFAPFGLAVDTSGNIVVAEAANNAIRRITSVGQVATLAGLAGNPGSRDGTGDDAQFRNPWSVTVDQAGNAYVADLSNFTIRKVTPAGVVTTLAGLAGSHGNNDGQGASAQFSYPHGLAVDGSGNLFVADTDNDMIREITPSGRVTAAAGQAGSPGSLDGVKSLARLRGPQSLAVDATGKILVADTDNLAIRVLTSNGTLKTLAIAGDLGHPDAIAADAYGHIYVVDTINHVIRKINSGGTR